MSEHALTPVYRGAHKYISRHYGQAPFCIYDESHIGKCYHWANNSGEYTRDLEDYIPLCPSCHIRMDATEEKGRKIGERSKGNKYCSKGEVGQYDKEGNLVAVWGDTQDAARALNMWPSAINTCIRGEIKSAGGFNWKRHGFRTEVTP